MWSWLLWWLVSNHDDWFLIGIRSPLMLRLPCQPYQTGAYSSEYISFLFIFYLSLYLSDRRIFIPRQNQNENIKYKNRNTERLAHIHPKTKEETFWPSDQYCVPFRVGNFFIIHNKYSLISSCWNWFSVKTFTFQDSPWLPGETISSPIITRPLVRPCLTK